MLKRAYLTVYYMGYSLLSRDKTEKKESIIGVIKKHKREIDKTIEQSHSMSNDMEL